jgi:hypothetical protein
MAARLGVTAQQSRSTNVAGVGLIPGRSSTRVHLRWKRNGGFTSVRSHGRRGGRRLRRRSAFRPTRGLERDLSKVVGFLIVLAVVGALLSGPVGAIERLVGWAF